MQPTDVLQERFKHGRKVGWAGKFDLALSRTVRRDDILDAENFGVGRVAVQGKAVASSSFAHVSRKTAEAKHRKLSVCIVRFHDGSNHAKCAFVLVTRPQVVE